MTRYFYCILAALVILCGGSALAKKKGGQPVITFQETSYNFGNIAEEGGPVTHEFIFTNTGDGNLVITDAKAECGCTRPEYPKNPIAPGKKGKIKVTFNPVVGPGGFQKSITIRSNAKTPKKHLKISGVIMPKNRK